MNGNTQESGGHVAAILLTSLIGTALTVYFIAIGVKPLSPLGWIGMYATFIFSPVGIWQRRYYFLRTTLVLGIYVIAFLSATMLWSGWMDLFVLALAAAWWQPQE